MIRYSFLAHEPADGHRAGAAATAGGAGYAVVEQAEAMRRCLAEHESDEPVADVAIASPHARTGASPQTTGSRSSLQHVRFEAPAGTLDETAALLAEDPAWRSRFAALLGEGALLVHHVPAARVAAALGRPFVCLLHSLWPSVQRAIGVEPSAPREATCRALLDEAAAIVVSTEAERSLLLATSPREALAGGLARRVHAIRHGVNPFLVRLAARRDLTRRRAAWRARLLPRAAPRDVVLYQVGRLVPYKRTLETIEAFTRFAARTPACHLLLVGAATDAAYAAKCKAVARAAPEAVAARIAFVGPQRIEAAPLAGDVLVHVSRQESWGRALDEALVFGKPAVLAASPFLAERADRAWPPAHPTVASKSEARALWIDASRPEVLEQALLAAVEDGHWRAACGAFHRTQARGLDWRTPARSLLALWNEVEAAQLGSRPFPGFHSA